VSDPSQTGSHSWQWARCPSGISLEISPPAIGPIFALDERTRRTVQSRLLAIADLAVAHPVPGPAGNLIVSAGNVEVRYSLDMAARRVLIEGLQAAPGSRLAC
jgi:hypothetical protein